MILIPLLSVICLPGLTERGMLFAFSKSVQRSIAPFAAEPKLSVQELAANGDGESDALFCPEGIYCDLS